MSVRPEGKRYAYKTAEDGIPIFPVTRSNWKTASRCLGLLPQLHTQGLPQLDICDSMERKHDLAGTGGNTFSGRNFLGLCHAGSYRTLCALHQTFW